MIQTKKLLTNIGTTQYTLTVSTNPSSATCTLTYNGESYNSKTAIVPSGTEISYSIYHSTYGTTTGTITMDSDKTLSCNGTYSTSYTDVEWSLPTGTTCSSFTYWSNPNRAFDGTYPSGSATYCTTIAGNRKGYIEVTLPQTVYLTSYTYYGYRGGSIGWTPIECYKVENDIETIISYGGDIPGISSKTYYNNTVTFDPVLVSVIRFYNNAVNQYSHYISEIQASGYIRTPNYTYYWNKTIS